MAGACPRLILTRVGRGDVDSSPIFFVVIWVRVVSGVARVTVDQA
jgi:hypothetical protein